MRPEMDRGGREDWEFLVPTPRATAIKLRTLSLRERAG